MTPERWAKVKEILGAALEKPETEREVFLDHACGSESSLRQEIERLLAAHDPHSLSSPVAGVLAGPTSHELNPGQTLGHYRVECKLGEGGMGAVYKAWDEQLRRNVALKIISGVDFAEPEKRVRFLREARASSPLNHPNVVTVFEVGSDSGVDFIAMECVDGQNLDRLIPAEGLPLEKALDYALQIASALAKAHAAGIIHRDLKPANIMVTGHGVVKLLDFGLARQAPLSEAETMSSTGEGVVAGTPAYMSPEQAEGRRVDARSDIFSFGAVIYEMLSGHRAFAGNSTAAILGAVLKDEPPALRDLPPEVQRLINLCLRKDPEQRLQHFDDVRVFLSESLQAREKQLAKAPHRIKLGRVSVLSVVAISAVLGLWVLAQSRKPAAVAMRVVSLTSLSGAENHPSFSPDGNQIAFVSDGEVYATVVDSAVSPVRLTNGPAGALYPAWSPDGRQIAFVRQNGLYLIPALGGPERRLADLQSPHTINLPISTLSWSPDGKWLAAIEGSTEGPWRISLVSLERGDKRNLAFSQAVPYSPTFSPDGRSLAYISCPHPLSSACDVHLFDLTRDFSAKGPPRRLTHQRAYMMGLAWAPDNRSVVYSAARCPTGLTALWRVPTNGSAPPERLDVAGLGAQFPTISSAHGRLAYVRALEDSDIWRYRIGGVGAEKIIASTMDEHNAQYSPDGKRIAFVSNRSGECPEIWISEQDGSRALQLTHATDTWQGTPRWSPDGGWIAFDRSAEDGHIDVYLMDASGGQLHRLTPFPSDESVPSWSRDGERVYFRSNRGGRNEIWKLPFRGGEAVQMTDQGGYVAFESFDGKTLYYTKSPAPGALFAKPLSGGPERRVFPDTVASRAFCPVEDGIYFIGTSGGSERHLSFFSYSTGSIHALTSIEEATRLGLTVSPDRKNVLFSTGRLTADLMLIQNFR